MSNSIKERPQKKLTSFREWLINDGNGRNPYERRAIEERLKIQRRKAKKDDALAIVEECDHQIKEIKDFKMPELD